MDDLFSYPELVGHRGGDTSMAGAEKIKPVAQALRDKVLTAVSSAGRQGITVVEMATRYDLDRMGIQPRFSELRKMRKIADSGLRRKNPSNVNVIVWTLPEYVLPAPGRKG